MPRRSGDRSAFCRRAKPPARTPTDPLFPVTRIVRWPLILRGYQYILDWDDVRTAPDPRAAAVEFAQTAFRHACQVSGWDPALPGSTEGKPPPVR
jgi:hypothetical protein